MATVEKWTPFGVALDITATAGTVTRTSATTFTVVLNVSWETYYNGAQTNYGMSATSGGVTKTISAFNGTKRSSGSGSFTGTYSISGNGAATKAITVTFKNFNTDNGNSASKDVTLSVSVPALPSWTIAYNANGGSNAPSSQTKWKDQSLTLSSTNPTRTGYTFKGWATSESGAVAYASGASYTANAAATLYAVWQANTYTVKYDANGGTGAPANQTKQYGTTLKLSSTIPTRANYNFVGWGTSASSTTATYAAGGNYTNNAAATLYAVWEIAYIKPIIYNVSAVRCDNTGREMEEGTYAKLSFEWETYYSNPLIVISVAYGGDVWESGYGEYRQTGTIGTFSEVISEGDLRSDGTFEITITVIDTDDINGNTSVVATLGGAKFPFDAVKDTDTWEVGVAFGKPAEKINVAEFALDAEFNKPVYGNVLGLNRLPEIPEGAELNDYIDTGAWAIYSNAVAATITCGGVLLGTNDSVPPARAGRFEVNSSTGEGVRAEQWSYLRQRFIPYNDSNPIWERDVARGEDNIWNYYDWWRSNLSPAASQKVYSKAAVMYCLMDNFTMSVASTYTQIVFNLQECRTTDRLKGSGYGSVLINDDISYVKISANILVKCGAAGTRHFRIQKTSGSTTTSHAWTVLNAAAGSNTAFNFTPIIIPVKKGDIIKIVYYTADTTDYIVAGSTANGRQTYLTVEEL